MIEDDLRMAIDDELDIEDEERKKTRDIPSNCIYKGDDVNNHKDKDDHLSLGKPFTFLFEGGGRYDSVLLTLVALIFFFLIYGGLIQSILN